MVQIAHKSCVPGSQNMMRAIQGESIDLELVLRSNNGMPSQVELVRERRSDGRIVVSPLHVDDGAGRYFSSISFNEPGLFRAKTRYRFNDGPWQWDRAPYIYCLVDPAAVADVRMYTFYPGINGTISEDWVTHLPAIKEMGFNTIHLLPITTMGPSRSPYAASKLFEIDPAYSIESDPEKRLGQFRMYVQELKKKDLGLCVDLVLNHVALDSEIANLHPEWLAEDPTESDGIKRAGWHDSHGWHKWQDLAFINYEGFNENQRTELWRYMRDYALFWSSFAAETGGLVRLDNLHSSYPEFMKYLLREIQREYPDIAIYAELFANEAETLHLTFKYGLNLILATTWEYKFVPQLRRYLKYLHTKNLSLRYFVPSTTHDSGTPTQEFGNAASTLPRLVLTMLMSPGPSGIVQGVEIGLPERVRFVGIPVKRTLKENLNFRGLIKTLNTLQIRYPRLSKPGNIQFIDQDHHAVIGVLRTNLDKEGTSFLICANFDIHGDQEITLPEDVIRRLLDQKPDNELDGNVIADYISEKRLKVPRAGAVAAILR